MIKKFKFTPQSALSVGTQIHPAPEAFGRVMSRIKPRMDVAYHFFKSDIARQRLGTFGKRERTMRGSQTAIP